MVNSPKFRFTINNLRMKKILLVSLVAVIVAQSCLKGNDTPAYQCDPNTYDSCALKASASEITDVENYLTSNNITGAVKHCSGLYYKITDSGTGVKPTVCSVITVRYTGKLTNGNIFDQASSPVSFNLSQVIRGWINGLPYLKKGGSMTLYIPPALGYGNQQVGTIPPNSMLIFDVNLVDVQ
jgi:FKBP-type peptidyl-prolyl cis-trans isomerase FkpA